MGNNIIYLVMDSQRTVNKKRKVVQMKNGIGIGKGNRLWLLKLKFFLTFKDFNKVRKEKIKDGT